MEVHEYGSPDAQIVLVQPVDDHDNKLIESELAAIREGCGDGFRLVTFKINDWSHELSPWEAPAVFGQDGFGNGAADTLQEILKYCTDRTKTYYIGGYSLAGLFALWAAYQTDLFEGVAAASPSMWFPGFADYMKDHEIRARRVYLSLGDREEKTRNPVMATVGDRIREAHTLLREKGIDCTLEWNAGNHFADADKRTAKAFLWAIGHKTETKKEVDLKETSKFISLILRHKPEAIGISLDEHGWADVHELIEGIGKTRPMSMEILEEIVRTDEKQRYSFNEDNTLIRANQGHSIPVDVELEEVTPPEVLYHGTGEKFKASIDREGLKPKSRLYVHLSADTETARKVGTRHGRPVIYQVDARKMHEDGYVFYKSVNGVWLTKAVPVSYLREGKG